MEYLSSPPPKRSDVTQYVCSRELNEQLKDTMPINILKSGRKNPRFTTDDHSPADSVNHVDNNDYTLHGLPILYKLVPFYF